jgi:hypothetical protein
MYASYPSTLPRNRLPWLLLLLAVHAGIVVWAAMGALAIERQDYAQDEFLRVTLGAFVLAIVAITLFARYALAIAVFGSIVVAAILLTPGAVFVVLLSLLSGYVLGTRVVRFVHPRGADASATVSWSLRMLIGIAVWIGLVCATAAFKIHYTPYYTAFLLLPLAFAWRDTMDALARVRLLAAPSPTTYGRTERIWIALLLTVVVLHLFIVARPDAGYDANAMHLQIAVTMSDAHRWRFDVDRYAWAVMPLGADWAYTVAYLLGGENAARFANLCFGALCCVLVWELIRRHARRELAIASVCLLASTPLAFAETGSLYVENLWSAYLLASLLVTLDMARGRMSNSLGWPVLALLAAGALQCKVIGILWLAPVLLGALLVSTRRTHERWPGTRAVLVLGGAVAIAAWPYANAWLRTGNPIFPFMNAWFRSPLADTTTSFINPMYVTPLRPWSIYEVLTESHRFIEGADGAAGFHWLLLLPLIVVALTRRRPAEQWLCAGLAAIFFATVYMQQAYLRYLLPAFMLLAVLGGWAASDLPDRAFTRLAIVLVGGALCLLQVRLMHTGSWPNAKLCIGCAFDVHARDDFVSRYMADRIVANYLNGSLSDARVGFLMLNAPSPAGYKGYSRAANWHDNPFFQGVAAADSADDIAALAQTYGLTHVVFRTNSPNMDSPAIHDFRETRVIPVWTFQDFVVAAITPPP